ncbi:MAG: glycogen/starch/alpha-glucan phosphorylase [Erysipelotrichaceae bacterium]
MFSNKKEFVADFTTRIVEKYGRSIAQSHITERYMVLGEMVRDYASINWKATKEQIAKNEQKQMFYFSMEFLIGRLLTNNMMNLGIYDVVSEGLSDLGIDINELEDMESDAGLGNGGLGRLAACFMDSLSSLNYAGNGNCIRYDYGLFKQKIVDGYQVEVPDQWLKLGNIWEVRKPKHAVSVKFWGKIALNKDKDNHIKVTHYDYEDVLAVPYDVPVVGYDTKMTNTLRLWRPEASDNLSTDRDFREYLNEISEISQNVYPDDSTEHGRILRLKQQYFFVSAGVQAIIKAHLRVYKTLDNLSEKIAIQMNDTHPVLVMPELMRILMDEYNYSWEESWNIVSKCVSYTNHTVLKEALEKWPVDYIQRLLPRIYLIIEEINRRQILSYREMGVNEAKINNMMIIRENNVYMANMAVYASTYVNGVAKLHTEILKDQLFNDFYQIYPNKFQNKTNGISFRRWLLYSNPQLVKMLDRLIGTEYHSDHAQLVKLMDYVDDKKVLDEFLKIKMQRKEILAKMIKEDTGIEVDTNMIFDTQAKRLHAYKRQLLNVLHIIYLYQQLTTNPDFKMEPRCFIFGAKAAPAYTFAKAVIKVIHILGDLINNDPKINKYLKVVFIPNYRVSVAEKLMNGSDVSEQISTAGKEASGTGNMKFMANGAITLGTLDGANVEIDELVGRENDVIFGLREEEVRDVYMSGHNAFEDVKASQYAHDVINALIDGTLGTNPALKAVYEELMYRNDEYLLIKDFDAYVLAQREIENLYRDKQLWAKKCLINIANSGFFSSDRTIEEYAKEIWHIEKVEI